MVLTSIIINVCLNGFITSHLLFWTLICHCLFQNEPKLSILNFGWPFNRVRDNKKILIRRTKDCHGHIVEAG